MVATIECIVTSAEIDAETLSLYQALNEKAPRKALFLSPLIREELGRLCY